jgi:tRNA (mo5U34)-methyltransferase
MNKEDKKKLVDSYKYWWHSIDFGDGVWSDGEKANFLPVEKRMISEVEKWRFPKNYFKGKRVLDIGSWDGYYAFLAEERGASEVVALDLWSEKISLGFDKKTKEGFDIAKSIKNSNVIDIDMNIYDATEEVLGKFDVVLFAGVLYHLQDPMRALRAIWNIMNESSSLMVETTTIPNSRGYGDATVAQFLPLAEANNDSTNFWNFSKSALKAVLEELNFVVKEFPRVIAEGEDGERSICYCKKPVDRRSRLEQWKNEL